MRQFLVPSMSPAEQARLLAGVYDLLALQVGRYHKHYHMGDNTSVPEETAKELLDSIWYTLEKSGGDPGHQAPAALLEQGQAVLKAQGKEAAALLRLVSATAPEAANDCYEDTLRTLESYLRRYDPLHFAGRVPELLEYPLLSNQWAELRGLDQALCYLKGLWQENQILAAVPPGEIEKLLAGFGPDFWGIPMNLCEQPLINAIGRVLLGKTALELRLEDGDRQELLVLLQEVTEFCRKDVLERALGAVCREWRLPGEETAAYAALVIPQLLPRLDAALRGKELRQVFL